LLVVLALVMVVGCGQQDESELRSPPMVLVEDVAVREARPDSLWLNEVIPSIAGGPSSNLEGRWIAEARWFRLARSPMELHTYQEMAQLEADGKIGEDTPVGLVRYRFLVEAEGLPEAQEKLRQRVAAENWPPDEVYRSMKKKDEQAASAPPPHEPGEE
jgi:hypothetical protein